MMRVGIFLIIVLIELISIWITKGTLNSAEVFTVTAGFSFISLTWLFRRQVRLKYGLAVFSIVFAIQYPISAPILMGLLLNEENKNRRLILGLIIGSVLFYHNYFIILPMVPLLMILKYYHDAYKQSVSQLTHQLDEERKLRYHLEEVKRELLESQQEIVQLTEVHERNRIARTIHDEVGHQLTGTLLALETSMMMKDDDIKNKFLEKAHHQLKHGIDTIRETVHDLSTKEAVGFSSVLELIDDFVYCAVEFNYSGDVNTISSGVYVVLIMNIKEAFTNIMKYSNAKKIKINLESTDAFIRLCISDDGQGSHAIKEGLGLSNMRQRLTGVNGILNYHSKDGFHLVMYIKRENESNYSR